MAIARSRSSSRSAFIRRLLGGALPATVLILSGRLVAGDAVNTASLVLPAGTVDADLANNTAVDTDAVNALIQAAPDSVSGISGFTGGTAVVNVLSGDTVNRQPASATNAVLALAPGATVPAGLSFDPATGAVGVAAGTPAGTYSFDYQICEAGNPGNCRTATVSIGVVSAPIAASDDAPAPVNSATGASALINVFANDTLNGVAVNPAQITATVQTPAANPGVTLDPATGLVSVAPNVPAGTYTIAYQICEIINPGNCSTASVTVVVAPAVSNLAGTVYLDVNGNRVLDSGDERRADWIVEVLRNGAVVGTTTTDAQGNYSFTGLPSGAGYEVRFRNPENRVVYGEITDLTLGQNATLVDENLPIDPSGVVYNSVTRAPVAGAMVTLTDAAGNPLPADCFVDSSQRSQVTGASGQYRFDIVPGAAAQCPTGETAYRIVVGPPAGFSFVSTVLLPQPGALDPTGRGSPVQVSTSIGAPSDASPVYYLSFRLASGDPHVTNNHIPLDPFLTRSPLVVTKTSTRRSANAGELVPYEITVRNNENVQRAGVDVIDILPPGMKYVPGSASVGGVATEPAPENDNRELVWHNQVIPANGTVRYNLTLVVGAGVTSGERINTGVAENAPNGSEISNRGTASVSIVPSSVFDCSELLGKVFEDTNRNGYQDEGEPGVPGARLATVNGQLVTTDQYGRYHIACAAVPDSRIGSNYVLKLDLRSVPLGWVATTDNPRSVRLTRGKFGELNFGVAPPPQENGSTTRKGGE